MLFETICLHDGYLLNLKYHQARMNASRKILFGCDEPLKLDAILPIPAEYVEGKFKYKVYYQKCVLNVEFLPYQQPTIETLKLVHDDGIDYSHKFVDRSAINALHERRGQSHDILIVKNGLITDTSYANVCFYSKDGGWCTPRTPLLPGTMRQKLISEGSVAAQDISPEMLQQFEQVSLINAMLPLGNIVLPVPNSISE